MGPTRNNAATPPALSAGRARLGDPSGAAGASAAAQRRSSPPERRQTRGVMSPIRMHGLQRRSGSVVPQRLDARGPVPPDAGRGTLGCGVRCVVGRDAAERPQRLARRFRDLRPRGLSQRAVCGVSRLSGRSVPRP